MNPRWSLPGPAAFLDQALQGLREGQNLVLASPATMVAELTRALEDRLRDDAWHVRGPLLLSHDAQPQQLFEELDLHLPRRSAAALLERLPASQLVLIEGVGPAAWPAWVRFLCEYEAASRAVSAFDRPLLVVAADGVPQALMPQRGAALRTLVWDGVIGELEVVTWAVQRLRSRGEPIDPRRRLLARTVARLALWDLDLADFLLEQPAQALFDPLQLLRGALDAVASPQPGWEGGGAQCFDGEPLTHSLLLAARGDPQGELAMRLWAAQAAEVLPVLEMHRRALAQRMQRTGGIRLPLEINGERIGDLADLEIGSLFHLACKHRLSEDIRRVAGKWRWLRNKLAHLEPLSADESLDPDLLAARPRT